MSAEVSAEALQALWATESGQLWTVRGRRGTTHRLLIGDCRNAEDVDRLMDGSRANVAFTSPPYASQRRYDEGSDFRPIPPDEYVGWWESVQASVRRHLAPDGSFFVNIRAHSVDGERHPYVLDLVLAHKRRWHWCFIDDFCWVRAGVPGMWPQRFKNGHEPVYHFALSTEIKFRPEAVSTPSKHAFKYDPAHAHDSVSGSGLLGKEHAAGYEEGLARPSNVIEVGTGGAQVTGMHPAEFPVGLPRWFILAFSDAGDICYEPFAGSGSLLVAAEQTGRAGYGMEISPRYAAVALERMAGLGLVPVLEGAPAGSGHRPYGVLVDCATAAESGRVYQQLTSRGLNCRQIEAA